MMKGRRTQIESTSTLVQEVHEAHVVFAIMKLVPDTFQAFQHFPATVIGEVHMLEFDL